MYGTGLSSNGLKAFSSYFRVGLSGCLERSPSVQSPLDSNSVRWNPCRLITEPPTLGSYLTAEGLSAILKIHKFFPQCLKAQRVQLNIFQEQKGLGLNICHQGLNIFRLVPVLAGNFGLELEETIFNPNLIIAAQIYSIVMAKSMF